MTTSPAGSVDGAKRSILEFNAEHGGVVRIEHILTDPVAGSFSERFQPAIAALGLRVIPISAVTGEGIGTLLDEIDRALVPVRSVIQSNPSRERTL